MGGESRLGERAPPASIDARCCLYDSTHAQFYRTNPASDRVVPAQSDVNSHANGTAVRTPAAE
jgi:hypothetical protein